MSFIKLSDECGLQAEFDMPTETARDIVKALKLAGGASVQPMDSECSVQVQLRLADGRAFRFGYTDEDLYDNRNVLWIDQYPTQPNPYTPNPTQPNPTL